MNLTGTPSVNVANTAQVQVVGTPNVNVTGTPNVNVTNTPQVQVANSSSSPVPTRAVDNPGLEPFEFASNSNGNVLDASFMVPTGMTLVIENVAFWCSAPSAATSDFKLFVNSNVHTFAPAQYFAGGAYVMVANQVTRIYAASGSTVTLTNGIALPAGSACSVTVDGHYVGSL